jgi:hypothetical protein
LGTTTPNRKRSKIALASGPCRKDRNFSAASRFLDPEVIATGYVMFRPASRETTYASRTFAEAAASD